MMNRKTFIVLYFSTIALVSVFLVYRLVQSIGQKKVRAEVGSLLPDFTLYDMDRKSFKLTPSEQPTVMVFFNSTCENCIYEAQIIKKNIALFGDVCIVMLSTEELHSIQQFSQQMGLVGYHNIMFARIYPEDQDKFGQISFPYILVYGSDHRLMRKFHGTVEPREILQYVHAR